MRNNDRRYSGENVRSGGHSNVMFTLPPPKPILGNSSGARSIRNFVDRYATAGTARILLYGETGTGKELAVRHLHHRSSRTHGPFVPVNCASFAPTLAESELFGHERGAFSGADHTRRGVFELAHGGTLFLDEIAELPLPLQAKLLRVTQFSVVTRLGAEIPVPIDVRIIAATHRQLDLEVNEGRFREDLYSRLKTIEFRIPPLRERTEDIEPLATQALEDAAKTHDRPVRRLSKDAVATLLIHHWPGNVRQLEQEMERLTFASDEPDILPDELDAPIHKCGRQLGYGRHIPYAYDQILRALRSTNGNISRAAKQLGIHRTTLWRKMREIGVTKGILVDRSGPMAPS